MYGLKNFTKIFCGTTPPPIFEVNTQALFVTLHMDWTVADHSFDAYYYIGGTIHIQYVIISSHWTGFLDTSEVKYLGLLYDIFLDC